jgi:hypothetical protein
LFKKGGQGPEKADFPNVPEQTKDLEVSLVTCWCSSLELLGSQPSETGHCTPVLPLSLAGKTGLGEVFRKQWLDPNRKFLHF